MNWIYIFLVIKYVGPVYDLRIIFLQSDCKNFDLSFHNIIFSDWTQSHVPYPRKFPENKTHVDKSHNILPNFIIIVLCF